MRRKGSIDTFFDQSFTTGSFTKPTAPWSTGNENRPPGGAGRSAKGDTGATGTAVGTSGWEKRGERQTREGRGEEKAEKEKEANPSHHGQTKKAVSSFRHDQTTEDKATVKGVRATGGRQSRGKKADSKPKPRQQTKTKTA